MFSEQIQVDSSSGATQPNQMRNAQPRKLRISMGPKLRSGIQTITGFMPAGVLIPNGYVIPYHDPATRKGYQRPPQEIRINELATDLKRNRVDLPTAVLLNIRKGSALEVIQGGALDLEVLAGSRRQNKFYVVDGQHRILALHKLIESPNGELWRDFVFPFVCMLGADEDEEMEQFHVVNSKAKSVRTDLALLLLRERAEAHPEIFDQAIERGKEWQILGQTIVERLADHSEVWEGRIRLPAMQKGETTIPSASMVLSLKPLLASPFFGALQIGAQQKILDAFWHGIREVMPIAFEDAPKFVVQKGLGVIAMHAILVHVLEVVRAKNLPLVDPSSYSNILRSPLEELQSENTAGEVVTGLDFWRVAPAGAAGSYSSSAGRRVLISKIRQLLPGVEVS